MLCFNSITRHLAYRKAGIRTRATPLDLGSISQLVNMKCNCNAETILLSEVQLKAIDTLLPLWSVQDGEPKSLRRAFKAKNFVAAMSFLNHVAELAEQDNHHPDLSLRAYRDVELTLSTHDAGGLTINDLILAAKIDQLQVEYSSKWIDDQKSPEIRAILLKGQKR